MKPLRWLLLAALVAAAVWAAGPHLGEQGEIHALPAPGPVAVPAATAADIARGEYLARAGNCMTCHTERGGMPYAGGRAIDTPFGALYTSNLTPDPDSGLGRWSAEEFWRAMHHGRSRDGRLLYPAFPYPNYTQVRRADADAMFAYLRSLPPVRQPNRPHALRWPYSTQAALAAWRALYFRPGEHRDDAGQPAEWNRGAYLVRGLGHCSACHATRNALGAADLMDLSGGLIPMQGWYAPALTAPGEAGLQQWTLEDAMRLLRTGATERASVLGPMAEVVLHSTQHLREDDLRAMAVFLRAVPEEKAAATPPAVPAAKAVAERGARLYGQHCAQCHGEQGRGEPDAYPPLAGNRAVTLPVTANLVQVVLHGGYPPSTAGNPRPFGMPPFALVLSDADVAAVLTHLRTAWGNAAAPVSELDVARQRSPRQ